MKVLILSSEYGAAYRGVAGYTLNFSLALARRGVSVTVLTSVDQAGVDAQGIRVLGAVRKWNLWSALGIVRAIKGIGPDVVSLQYVPYMYSHYGVPTQLPVIMALLRMLGYNVVTTFHEVAIRFEIAKPKYWVVATLQRLIAYCLCWVSSRSFVSIEHYRRMLAVAGCSVRKLPVGSNIPSIVVSNEEMAALRQRIARRGEFIMATFGVNPRRTDLLPGVIARLRHEGIAVKWLAIGALPHAWVAATAAMAKDLHVDEAMLFTGPLSAADVFRHLIIADVFLVVESINAKGWGGVSMKSTALAAAFAAGLPVIGSKGDMTDDFFHDGKNIYLINSLDEDEIACAIKAVLSSAELRARLRHGAAMSYERELCWESIAGKYLQLYGETVRK